MKKASASRVAAIAFTVFFAVFTALALLSAAAFLHGVGWDPFVFAFLAYAALNATMAYGLYHDRRWVLPVLTLNLVLAIERAVGGASGFTAAAIVANSAVLAVVLARRDRQGGELWAITPVIIFAATQLLPYLIEKPMLQ